MKIIIISIIILACLAVVAFIVKTLMPGSKKKPQVSEQLEKDKAEVVNQYEADKNSMSDKSDEKIIKEYYEANATTKETEIKDAVDDAMTKASKYKKKKGGE